jgi:hypothetical protein
MGWDIVINLGWQFYFLALYAIFIKYLQETTIGSVPAAVRCSMQLALNLIRRYPGTRLITLACTVRFC